MTDIVIQLFKLTAAAKQIAILTVLAAPGHGTPCIDHIPLQSNHSETILALGSHPVRMLKRICKYHIPQQTADNIGVPGFKTNQLCPDSYESFRVFHGPLI
ncbi:hypothetical protein D3C81_1494530 [compost metagenome]